MKCQITTHVLDLIKGTPANNIPAVLEKLNNSESWKAIGNGTTNDINGEVTGTTFSYYGDLIFNTLASRSYLKVTTDQQLYDCDVEVRLIRRDGEMDVMKLPYRGEFQVKLRLLQTQ